ncbi:hypothetical protein AUJ68_05500 [Candidatus Woesearchaeota archaeon CG1_02_57_44]|nr:MAG: hypothetical protein AUJ68_05500 [Candidatus Woesearchaeota archaeon CG1_02_57_44]
MKDLAPAITRQRLLLEGFYAIPVDTIVIADYFDTVTKALGLRMYGEPVIFSPGGEGKEENQGYDAFVPLIDSGISLYIWSNARFLSLIIYTCKAFDEKKAIVVTKEFFRMTETQAQGF